MSLWQIRKIKHVFDSAKQDADVQTTVASAQTKHTILVGDDTDLLVLLLHPDIDANNIFVPPENTQTSKTEKVWFYNSARLGEHLLFMHAIFGCETTSRLFGLGKGIVVTKLSDSHFYKSAETFTKKNVSKEDVIFVGDTALVLLYGGSCAEGLDSLRCKWFCDKVPKSTSPVDHSLSHLLPLQLNTIAFLFIIKWWCGKNSIMIWNPRIGDGMLMMEDLCPYRLISQQHR